MYITFITFNFFIHYIIISIAVYFLLACEIFHEREKSIKRILKITLGGISNFSSSRVVQKFFFLLKCDKNRYCVPLSTVIMVTKRRAYDVAVREMRRMYDVLKRTKLLNVFPYSKALDNVLCALEGFNKVSIV